jgi:hypothetical protein
MMSDRKAELERKKAKLQAIREEKERRRREKEQKDVRVNIKYYIIYWFRYFVYSVIIAINIRSKKLEFVLQARIKINKKKLMHCCHRLVLPRFQVI